MSATPKTDAAIYETYTEGGFGGEDAVPPEFARTLERELAAAYAELARLKKPGYVWVPEEPSEAEIDAPRELFKALELGNKCIGQFREHFRLCGIDISSLPEWFRNDHPDTHLTKAGKAIIVRAMMLRAAKEAK